MKLQLHSQAISAVLGIAVGIATIGCDGGAGGNTPTAAEVPGTEQKAGNQYVDGRLVVPATKKVPDEVTKLARDFFVQWLKNHGETEIVNDASGVGLADRPGRLWAFLYGVSGSDEEGWIAELEYRVLLPDGREIVEFVAGSGGKRQDAIQMAMVNFSLSTFHVIYATLLKEADAHVQPEKFVRNGSSWSLSVGDFLVMGEPGVEAFSGADKQVRELLRQCDLDERVHWAKVVYAVSEGEVVECSVTFDNVHDPKLSDQVRLMEWPETDTFYLAKQFAVLHPTDWSPSAMVIGNSRVPM